MRDLQNSSMKSHWAILAGLRFILSVIVVAGHFALYIRGDNNGLFGAGYLNPLSAVYGFFILSGYSIAASLDNTSSGFIRRRFSRIWPLYLASMAFGLAVCSLLIPNGFHFPLGGLFTPGHTSALSIVASLLMLQTVIAAPISIIGPTWSLAAEWWHYMIAPILRQIPTKFLLVAIAVSFCLYLNAFPPGPGVAGTGALTHGYGIAVLSWLWVTGFVYYRRRRTPLAIVLLIAPALFAMTTGHSTGAPYFLTAFVLIAAEDFNIPQWSRRALNFLGDWSYSLYLFHMAGFIVMLHFGSTRSIITLSGAFGISLAALLLVDYPSRRWFGRKKVQVNDDATAVKGSQSGYGQTTA